MRTYTRTHTNKGIYIITRISRKKMELWYTYTHELNTQTLLDKTDARKICLTNKKQTRQKYKIVEFSLYSSVYGWLYII